MCLKMSPNGDQMDFLQKHTDDISAIDFSSNGTDVATGERGAKPKVCIWDSNTMQVKHTLKGNGITNSVRCLAFSPSGKVLGIIAEHDDHNVACYNTETGTLIAASKGDRGNVLHMAF
jgi:WD40 repeat protein